MERTSKLSSQYNIISQPDSTKEIEMGDNRFDAIDK